MSTWFETTERRDAYDGAFFSVRVDTVSMPDGHRAEREVVVHNNAVAVVPVLPDGTVILLKQYRHPVGGYLLEIPAGKLDIAGEEIEVAARRELVEEVGYTAQRLEHLTTFWNSAGASTERTHVYLGTDLRSQDPADDFQAKAEEADMEIVRLDLVDAVRSVRDGTITDAKTVIGLLLAERRADLGELAGPRD